MNRLQSALLTLRVVLIPLTVLELIYFGIAISASNFRKSLDADYGAFWIILVYHLIMLFAILYINWTQLPIPKNMKTKNTAMVTFMGILGMWLWMPSSDDIDHLSRM